ncbi:MAG TPA: GNAT family N-acetyltransferase [Terrimicrobiaceae bacterium]
MTVQNLTMTSQWIGTSTPSVDRCPSPHGWEVKEIDPSAEPRWDRIAASHPDSSFFHSAAWAKVLCKTYGHQSVSLLFSKNGEPVALLPLLEVSSPFTGRRGISLPFTDSCDCLLFERANGAFLLEEICALARKRQWKYFEIRGRLANLAPPAFTQFYGHSLDLRGGTKVLFANFESSVRRAIRKAEKSDLKVEVSESSQALAEFYQLHVQTRRRHGVPPQPFYFFDNIYNEVIKRGLGFICTARIGAKVVAAAVFFHTGKRAIFKFGASDEQYQELRANNLVMWHAIQSLVLQGFELLHLGRTASDNPGLRRFKLGWNATEETIEYCRFDTQANDWSAAGNHFSGFYNTLFSRMPLALNRLMGSIIYPHLD